MVVPWIGYIIWKNWVIHVLVFLVFHVFSTAELISIAKTVNLALWAFSLIFLHSFTFFGIHMHNIYHTSSISTTFGPLWNMGFPGLDPNLYLPLCPLCHKLVSLYLFVKFLFRSTRNPYKYNSNYIILIMIVIHIQMACHCCWTTWCFVWTQGNKHSFHTNGVTLCNYTKHGELIDW